MAAFVQGKQSRDSGSISSFSVSLDAASTSGNVIVLTMAFLQNDGLALTPPAGFTLVRRDVRNFGANSFQTNAVTWVKESAGETSFSVTFSTGFIEGTLTASEFSGIDVADITGDTDTDGAFGDTANCPSVDTTEADSIHYVFATWFDGTQPFGTPSGYTQLAPVADAADDGKGFFKVIASPGATGAASISAGGSNNWVSQSIVLNAGGGGGPTFTPRRALTGVGF